jgi:uncharacterized protein YegP (UPF0339 family)
MKIIIFKDKAKEWRFRIVAGNGEIIASSEGYKRKGGATKTAKLFKIPIEYTKVLLLLLISTASFGQLSLIENTTIVKIGEVNYSTGASVALIKKVNTLTVYTLLYKSSTGVADLHVNFTATTQEFEELYNILLSTFLQPENSTKIVTFKLSSFSIQASNVKSLCLVNVNGATFTITKRELKQLFAK